jgi:hypothetical protein
MVLAALMLASMIVIAFAPTARAAPALPDRASEARTPPLPLPAVRQLACPCTLWPVQAAPAVAAQDDNQAVELGVKFRTSSPGFIVGVRYYKSAPNAGQHLGSLWSRDGQLLARGTFVNESPSGWQQLLFSSPVAVSPNITYVASYHTDVGHYAVNHDYFATIGVQQGPLRALANGEDGPNGVYRYGASGFPTDTYRSSNYWVTPVFSTEGSDVVPPAISGVQVTDVSQTDATIRWSTDEPSDSRVDIGPTTAYGTSSADPARVTTHAMHLSGLAPNTGYHVRVASRDAAGNLATSGDLTLTTLGAGSAPTSEGFTRPKVSVVAVPSGPGQLQVVLTAGTAAQAPGNRLVAVRFSPGVNALVDAGGQSGRTGDFTVVLADRPSQTTFTVRRVTPGVAVTVPFTVIDDYGEFRSFVGGGPGSF